MTATSFETDWNNPDTDVSAVENGTSASFSTVTAPLALTSTGAFLDDAELPQPQA
jgi:hypothetical protein